MLNATEALARAHQHDLLEEAARRRLAEEVVRPSLRTVVGELLMGAGAWLADPPRRQAPDAPAPRLCR